MAKKYGVAGKGARDLSKRRFIDLTIRLSVMLLAGAAALIAGVMVYAPDLRIILSVFLALIGMTIWVTMFAAIVRYYKDINRILDRGIIGAQAEENVAKLLEQLPDTYHVFHDIPCDAGNIDHLVIGPTGIFILETKSHKGKVTEHNGQLLKNSRPFEKNFVRQALLQVNWLKKRLGQDLDNLFINASIVFTRAYVRANVVNGVVILNQKRVLEYITGKPEQVESQRVDKLVNVMLINQE